MISTDSIIRDRIAAEVRDPTDAGMVSLLAGVIHDDFAAADGDDLAAIDAAIAEARVKFAPLFRQPEPPPPPPPTFDMATATGRQAATMHAKLAAIEAGPNPYSATSLNRTAQAVLEKNRPDLARQLKVAGGR